MGNLFGFCQYIGGLVLLGVDENLQEKDVSKRFRIIGVDEPSKIITDFWNTLNSDKVNGAACAIR